MSGSGKMHDRVVLTDTAIKALKPESAPYRVSDMRAAGLALRVATDGGKTWDLAFRIARSTKVKRLSLGRYEDVGLEAARVRAGKLTSAARLGRDLVAEEDEEREVRARQMSVDKLIALYVARRVTGRLRSARLVERAL
jgi:Arm DNA-binding domain